MNRLETGIAVALALLASPLLGSIELKAPGASSPILVDLPANHEAGKKWPAMLVYHGQGGQPNTTRTRALVGEDDWIVVGMAYAHEGQFKLSKEALDRELAVLRSVRNQLQATHGLDPKRLHTVGYSKGGWMVDNLLQIDRTLAGGAILMAGHLADFPTNPKRFSPATPVFIGVGRNDPNHFYALRALLFYRTLGAKVDMEVWPDLGHQMPPNGSPGLKEWFQLRNGVQPNPNLLANEIEAATRLAPRQQWSKLTALQQRPFATVTGSPWPEKIRIMLKALEENHEVAQHARLVRAHRSLLARELKARTAKDFLSLDSGYAKLLAEAKGSEIEELAQRDYDRVLTIVRQVRSQTPTPSEPGKPLKPNMPKNDRLIPGDPRHR